MDHITCRQLVHRIHDLMGQKMHLRGSTLEDRVRRAGRRLPKDVRRAAKDLVTAEKLSKDPGLALRLDPGQVSDAYDRMLRYLERVDPAAAKSKARFDLAASLALRLLIVAALTLALLRWRGFL